MKITPILCLVLLALGIIACGNEYPDNLAGRRVSGRIFYDGVIDENLSTPAIGVFVYATPPLDMGVPNGTQMFVRPDLVPPEGLAYEVRHLDPYEYTIFAAVIDLDDPDQTPSTIGAWPDVCSLLIEPVMLEITENEPLTDLDIHLYDNLGLDDPCFTGS